MTGLSFSEGGLVYGEAIGKSLDDVGFETSDVTKSKLDDRLMVGRLERDEVRAEVHYDPESRRIY